MASAPPYAELRESGALRNERDYRRDIEGLRAVAVMPIVLFHAGVSGLGGGFIGVDIFFVISGYLITLIVAGELKKGTFRLDEFYRRRVVRIFPALFAMLAGMLAVGGIMMLPIELQALANSTAAAVGFVSNIYFGLSADYFAPAAETIPLLHTWSLGVEEQFYIFYPILLMLSCRYWPGRLAATLVIVILASLAWSIVATRLWPQAGFYLLPSRAWELALGGLIAVGAVPRVTSTALRSVLAAGGLLLIAVGCLVIRPESGFPWPWALVPCLGSALLIAYGRGAVTEPLLTLPPVRLIGRISYSLYLWHWPVIALYRLPTGMTLDPFETAGLVAASLALAWLSYALVEQPMLTRFRKGPTRRILLTGIAGMVALGSASAAVSMNSQTLRSHRPDVVRIADYGDYRDSPAYRFQYRPERCFLQERNSRVWDPGACLRLSASLPNLVVVGNSHAAHLWRAFALRYPQANMMQATVSGCRPTIDTTAKARCRHVYDSVFGPLLATRRVDRVILSARWHDGDVGLMAQTIAAIRRYGTPVLVVGPIMEYDGAFPLLLARAMARGDPASMVDFQLAERRQLDRRMARAVIAAGGDYVSLIDLLCPDGDCRLLAPDGAPMHFDYGHLTLSGALWLVDRIAEQPLDPALHERRPGDN
ncbi:MAG: acyltransferase family protein [Sphingosinicella sp.]